MGTDVGIETKDYWTILAMRACNHVPTKIVPIDGNNNQSILVYTFSDEAKKDFDSWMRGENKEPFGTIRKIQQAGTEFKNNLHRFCK